MFRSLAFVLVPVLACLALACDRSTPTEPEVGLTGTWQGELRAAPSGEDWSRVTLVLNVVGGTSTGSLTSRNGASHPVSGQRASGGAYVLEVEQLPQLAPCNVTLVVEEIRSTTLEGTLSGRCPNTLMSRFRLERLR